MRNYVAKVEQHSFFPAPLGPGSTVVDLGMNLGGFSRWITANTDARVVGVEPVPALYESMPALPRTTVLQAAVSAASGSVELVLNEESCAAIESTGLGEAQARRVTVRAITLEELLAQQGIQTVDLLKVDIEGAELDVFADAPADVLRRCRQITCEFHNFLDPTLTPRVRAAQRRLEMLGFTKMTFSLDDTDTLFLQSAQLGLNRMDLFLAIALHKYARGAIRRLRRILGDIA
jgi:FkbM family methyltransferase